MKIFVVDDERIIRVSLADELRDNGYDVYEFAHASPALVQLEELNPDLIITDLMMGELSGYEIIERARQLSYTPEIVVITGHDANEHATRVLKFGAFDYLTKQVYMVQ